MSCLSARGGPPDHPGRAAAPDHPGQGYKFTPLSSLDKEKPQSDSVSGWGLPVMRFGFGPSCYSGPPLPHNDLRNNSTDLSASWYILNRLGLILWGLRRIGSRLGRTIVFHFSAYKGCTHAAPGMTRIVFEVIPPHVLS